MAEPPPQWEPVVEPRVVYRYVAAVEDPTHRREWFLTDREARIRPWPREKEWDELRDARSFFGSDEAARAEWMTVYERTRERGQEMVLPESIAKVRLEPGHGFEVDDLGEPDEHLLIKGTADDFVPLVLSVYPAKAD
jgi:hypothetical protein